MSGYRITETITNYEKHGTKWKQVNSTAAEIPEEYYHNATDPATVRFFRNIGGYERVTRSYTCAGYIPVQIISINPTRDKKTVRRYEFTLEH